MALFLPYLAIILGASISSLLRWKLLSKADLWICLLLCLAFVQESVSFFYEQKYQNNYPTYHFYTPVELSFICFYFVRSLRLKRPNLTSGIMAGVCVLLSVLNTIYLQPLKHINSNYLLIEGCICISFCLLSFYNILLRDDYAPSKQVQFWITIAFLFYWSLSYVNLGLYGSLAKTPKSIEKILTYTLYFANILFYIGMGVIFLRYPKLIPSGE